MYSSLTVQHLVYLVGRAVLRAEDLESVIIKFHPQNLLALTVIHMNLLVIIAAIFPEHLRSLVI